MATLAQSASDSHRPSTWFLGFLKGELAPYPGRVALVARMVIAATIVMLITMTFRLPYGAYAAIYALTISRESPQTTLKTVKAALVVLVLGAVYVLIGARFFLDDPMLRMFWIIGTLFLSFYVVRVMTNYGAASRFGYLIIITTPLWDLHIPAEMKVEGTLWALWSITIGSLVTVAGELIYAAFRPGDDLIRSIAESFVAVEETLASYSSRPLDETSKKKIMHLAMLGSSRLRRILQRSTHSRHYRERMSAVVALVGRLIDLCANLTQFVTRVDEDDQRRMRSLAAHIAAIRTDLLNDRVPGPGGFDHENDSSGDIPFLHEMQRTVSQISEVFSDSGSTSGYLASPPAEERKSTTFVLDALSNSEHLKFALKGCLAASLCYIFYTAVDWPGINTSLTTCLLTALSTIGSSRQKQVLRVAGAIAGGAIVGIGAQIFVLPRIDSIAGFTVLFVVASIMAAWSATSSPRLSYFGLQFAVAFYLINLQEFTIQTSLAVARDRVAGILVGLFAMWLVFDQLWGLPAAVEMKRTFISNLRSLGQLLREPLPGKEKVWRSDALREKISATFDKVRGLADAVLFEFGPSRQGDLELRDRIRRWQPQLRMLFMTRIALLKYRLQVPGFALPEAVRVAQLEFDHQLARMLDGMADRLEGKTSEKDGAVDRAFDLLEQSVRTSGSDAPQALPQADVRTFLVLSRNIERVALSLDKEIG
jgi:multidrug resistance protein MdtO